MAGESRTRRSSAAAAASRYEDDTEITLGTGKMLVLFFGLVVLCGLFFGTGYMIGHNSARIDAHNDAAAASAPVASLTNSGNSANSPNKPSAGDGISGQGVESDAGSPAVGAGPVSDRSTIPKQVMDSTTGVAMSTEPVPTAKTAATQPSLKTVSAPVSSSAPAVGAASGSYWVQVAAVSREEDAQALVNALKRKQYAASAVTNAPIDKLFHVEIGPFAAPGDADGMKKRLVADGYSAIVKK